MPDNPAGRVTPDGYHVCPACGHHTSAAVAGCCTVITPQTLRYCGCDCYRVLYGESLDDVIAGLLWGNLGDGKSSQSPGNGDSDEGIGQ